MKKGDLAILFFAFALFFFPVASAQILNVSMGPLYANSSQNTLYNFTILDNSTAGVKFVQVNLTVPSGFSILSSTNGTSSASSLSISGNTLSWTNASGVIFGNSYHFFWFNATNANSVGTSNFIVSELDNFSNTNSTTKSVTLYDVTPPLAGFDGSVTPSNNSKLNQSYIPVKIAASDNVGIDNVSIILLTGSGSILNASNVKSPPFIVNFTGLSNGNYSVYATAFDTSGNTNVTSRRYVLLNFTQISPSTIVTCQENWTCISWGQCSNTTKTKTCIVLSDSNNCGTNLTKPSNLTHECNPECANWVCGDWVPSPCVEGQNQTMYCTDSNGCEQPKNVTRPCQINSSSTTSGKNTSEKSGDSSLPTGLIIVIVFVLASIAAVIVILVKLKNKAYSSSGNSDFGNEDELGRPKPY